MFLGQPYRLTEDPSASSLQSRSQATSTDPYEDAFGKDPDDSALEIIDLQEENNNLREHIHNLQQKICELEEEVNVTNLRKSSLASRTHDRILYLEEQVRKYEYVTDKTTSTPVRNTTSKSTPSNTPLSPLRYRSMTPSHAAPIRAQIQSPDTSFKRQIQPSVGTPTLSRSPFVSHSPFTSSPAEVSPSSCRPLIPYYINLYHLGYLSTSINLIADYTPAESRIEELFKLGLEEDVCQTLANAMALDKGLLNDWIGWFLFYLSQLTRPTNVLLYSEIQCRISWTYRRRVQGCNWIGFVILFYIDLWPSLVFFFPLVALLLPFLGLSNFLIESFLSPFTVAIYFFSTLFIW